MIRSAILIALLPASGLLAEGGVEPPEEPPAAVPLPEAGTYAAADLFELVEEVSGKPVRPESGDLEELPVRILADIAGRDQTIGDLLVLLGAHGIYLFPHRTEAGEAHWVATRDRAWEPPARPLHTRIFTIRPRSFRRAVAELGKFLEEKNRALPAGAAPTIALPVAATGRIIVRSESRPALESVSEFLHRLDRLPAAADEQGLYAFAARNLRAEELHQKLLEFLSEEEARRLRVVFPRGTNVLWIRTHPELWRKVRGVLLVVDGLNAGADGPAIRPQEERDPGPVEEERDAGPP